MMLKTRFLTSLAAKALVVAVAAGGGMLISGVANADTPGSTPAVTSTATPTPTATPTVIPVLAATPTPVATPAATPTPVTGIGSPLSGLLPGGTGGLGGLNPKQLVKPILDPILSAVSKTTGLDLTKIVGPALG